MKIPIEDFVRKRAEQGVFWPKKRDIYQLKFKNLKNFRSCLGFLGKKCLIDPPAFEVWLEAASAGGGTDVR